MWPLDAEQIFPSWMDGEYVPPIAAGAVLHRPGLTTKTYEDRDPCPASAWHQQEPKWLFLKSRPGSTLTNLL